MIRVLVADDHAMMREGLKAILSAEPNITVVGEATDGNDAVRKTLDLTPDVVVMDISMPRLNGLEALAECRKRGSTARIVILTMHSSPARMHQAFDAGADGYILKDAASGELVTSIRTVILGRRYVCPALRELAPHGGPPAQRSPLLRLSKRERHVLQLVVEGYSSSQIGTLLKLSPKTVGTYRSRIMQKLGVSDVTGLVKFSVQHGVTSID